MLTLVMAASCSYSVTEPCSTVAPATALLRVVVDWSDSGLTDADAESGLDVHRLSLRFYPLDGGDVFERYLEVDLYSGSVDLPVGRYAVVAINESVDDYYWSGALSFVNTDSFDDLAVELSTSDSGVSSAAKGLAAWSLSLLEVTSDMISYSRDVTGVGDVPVVAALSAYEQQQLAALEAVDMVAITRNLQVGVTAENLGSIQTLTASVSGLTRSVNISTGRQFVDPTTHTFELSNRDYTATRASSTAALPDASGRAWDSQLTLGHADDATHSYELNLDVVLTDGTIHTDDEQLTGVDITSTITQTASTSDYQVEHSITVPQVTSETVGVESWGDGGSYTLE